MPAGGGWVSRQFNVEYGYDKNYGRLKAIGYPGAGDVAGGPVTGEIVGLNYNSPNGYLLGEAANGPGGSPTYRNVTAMSERAQVAAQTFGNGVAESLQYDESTGMPLESLTYGLNEPLPSGCSAQQLLVRQVDYKFDQFLNVASQAKQFLKRDPVSNALVFSGCTPSGVTATESYQYDDLQRITEASRGWTGMMPNPYPPPASTFSDSYSYDDLGNILSKPDYATAYTYGSSARTNGLAGPHAVSTVTESGVTTPPFAYDQNGNMTSGDGRTIAFDYLDRPITITMGGVTTQFQYSPDGTRYIQNTKGVGASPYPKTVYYVDKLYERLDWSSGVSEEKTYAGSSVVIYRQGATRDVRYLHLDRLGSLDSVTNTSGAEVVGDSHGFDVFGKPLARDWQWSGAKLHPSTGYQDTTERGFTGHEHLDETYLIHMNGRVYDYRLGRFLSVDPIISNPVNSQSINPYSYIGNNPLSGVDPTGFECEGNGTTGTHSCGQSEGTVNNLFINGTSAAMISKTISFASPKESRDSNGSWLATGTWNQPVDKTGSPANQDRNDGSVLSVERYTRSMLEAVPTRGERLVAQELAEYRAAQHDLGVQAWLGIGDSLVFGAWTLGKGAVSGTVDLAAGAVRSSEDAVAKFGAHMDGPLAPNVARYFRGGSYSQVTIAQDTDLFRVWGGTSGELSAWWSRVKPSGPLQAMMDLALPPGNTAQNLVRIRVPARTTFFEGSAEASFGWLGGGNQVFLPRLIDPTWIVK